MDLIAGLPRDLMGTIALIGLLAAAYGSILRRMGPTRQARMLLGALYGAAAVLAMQDHVQVAGGVIVDLRHLPLALAGAFLGRTGAAVALGMALSARIGLGGVGVPAGIAGILIAGAAGLAWDLCTRAKSRRGTLSMLGLALLSGSFPAGAALLSSPLATGVLALLPVLLPLHVVGTFVVATLLEQERTALATERALARAADHDALTGLLNRRGFDQAVARLPVRQGGALLLLDLDHFKRINDLYGHPAGDAVLRALGGRMARVLDRRAVVARLGGEEFAVFLPGSTPGDVREVARRLCDAIRSEPFALPGGDLVTVTSSIGGAWGLPTRMDSLTARADAALYEAKRAGRDGVRFAAEGPALSGARLQIDPGVEDRAPQAAPEQPDNAAVA